MKGDDKEKTPEQIKTELEEMRRIQAEAKRKARELMIQLTAAERDKTYGPRRGVNLDLPIADDEWLEHESDRRNLYKYEFLHLIIEFFRNNESSIKRRS